MSIPTSYKAAGLVLLLVVGYFGVRTLIRASEPEPADGGEGVEAVQFSVLATRISATPWQEIVNVRGRTKAFRTVIVRSESTGVVAATPTMIGTRVVQGDVLCRLKVGARQSQLDQARAAVVKARIDYNVASELKKEGLGSNTALASAKAALDLVQAGQLQAKLALDHIKVSAPFEGIFDERMAEVGDFLAIGDPCGVVIQQSPFLVVGAVSEREVGKIKSGDRGVAVLATGETIEGKIRFVATAADTATRTFGVELEVPNEGGDLRDGVTAQFQVFAHRRNAHLVRRSSLILNDAGEIGVRLVDDSGYVRFAPVALLGEGKAGVYVSGLEGAVSLITRGQEFVIAGQTVSVSYTQDEGTRDGAVAGR